MDPGVVGGSSDQAAVERAGLKIPYLTLGKPPWKRHCCLLARAVASLQRLDGGAYGRTDKHALRLDLLRTNTARSLVASKYQRVGNPKAAPCEGCD